MVQDKENGAGRRVTGQGARYRTGNRIQGRCKVQNSEQSAGYREEGKDRAESKLQEKGTREKAGHRTGSKVQVSEQDTGWKQSKV